MKLQDISRVEDLHWKRTFKMDDEREYIEYGFVDDDDVVYSGILLFWPNTTALYSRTILQGLQLVPNERVYPKYDPQYDIVPSQIASSRSTHVKGPLIERALELQAKPGVRYIATRLFDEAKTLQFFVSRHPHPGIVSYHGCVVRNGLITGLCFDRYKYGLHDYLSGHAHCQINVVEFMAMLRSALDHIHGLGWAHNDLKPDNIMIDDKTFLPVLIDFGSCNPVGTKMGCTGSTLGWVPKGWRKTGRLIPKGMNMGSRSCSGNSKMLRTPKPN